MTAPGVSRLGTSTMLAEPRLVDPVVRERDADRDRDRERLVLPEMLAEAAIAIALIVDASLAVTVIGRRP